VLAIVLEEVGLATIESGEDEMALEPGTIRSIPVELAVDKGEIEILGVTEL
jgi:hypothetical protein